MKIRRIHIRNFRKLTGPIVIDGLGDGLTVIAGDNEEGKSTVLAAIQAVLFDRHGLGGEAALEMLPFGAKVRPEIGIDFELDGGEYTLRKAFHQKSEAELSGPDGRWTGEAVEERLRDMLSFDPPGRGAAKSEHRGIWGLFWVEQATTFAQINVGGSGREAIIGALESEVGQVLGGERGRALVAAVSRRVDEHYTRTGRPKGALKEGAERIEALKTTLSALTEEFQRYNDQVDELGKLRARLATLERDKALEAAQKALAESEAAQRSIDALGVAIKEARQNEEVAGAEWKAAQQAWASRAAMIEALAAADRDAEKLGRDAAAADQQRQAAEAAKNTADAAFETARTSSGRAEAMLAAADLALRRARLTLDINTLERRRDNARTADQAARRLRDQARAIRIDDDANADLRRLEKAAGAAELRLETVATRIDLAPDAGRRAYRDRKPCADDGTLRLTETTHLTLDGFGSITVTPGGDDLASRRRDADATREALARSLADLGAADAATAERLAAERTALLTEAESQKALVAAHAPEGVDALERSMELIVEELGELSAGAMAMTVDLAAAEKDRDAAARSLKTARDDLHAAEQALHAASARHTDDREAWVIASTGQGEAERRAEQLRLALDVERRAADDKTVQGARDARADAHEKARAVTAQRRRALDDADPEAVRLRLARDRDALARLSTDIDAQRARATELETVLRTLGQAGLGERIQEIEGDLANARASHERLERRANAVKLLLEALTAAERDAKETFLGPVRERIRPYLRLLLPDADLSLANETLGIVSLRRGGIEEPFDSLSIGTREQLAVLTRLAFADFLRAKGRPAAIILDDALAYADDERFDRMQLVLRKAAENLQIIILTCRERDYHGLGAPIIRLSDCARDAPISED